MKVCSVCQKCYDDSDATCSVDDGHGSLYKARSGNRRVVEGYLIKSRIESRSPVELYEATQTATKKSVSICFTAPGGSFSETETRMHAAAALEHPNLAGVLEFGRVSNKELFAVFGDVPVRSLESHLANSLPLTEKRAIAIVRQIAEGLEALHANGIVHGSLNPANIFFASDEENSPVKLTNYFFGGSAQGTPADQIECNDPRRYYSPEQSAGGEIDFRSDIYSLALVFYELLLGRLPYEPTDQEAAAGYVFDKLEVWHLHAELRALIAHSLGEALKRRPDLRPKSTAIFVRQMRHLEQIATRALEASRDFKAETPVEFSDASESASRAAILEKPRIPEKRKADEPDASFSKPQRDATVFPGSIDREVTVEPELHVPAEVFSERIESDFVEVPIGPGMMTERAPRRAANPAAKTYSSKAFLYISGLVVSAVLGGVITFNFFEYAAATSDGTGSANRKTDTNRTGLPDTSPSVAQVNPGDDDAPETDETYERARELDRVIEIDSPMRFDHKVSASGFSKSRSAKKAARRNKRKPGNSNKNEAVKEPELPTRPRFVKDIIIYY